MVLPLLGPEVPDGRTLNLSTRSEQPGVHIERSKTEEALMAAETELAEDVALSATPHANHQRGTPAQRRDHRGQRVWNVIRRNVHQRAHRPSGIEAPLSKGRRINGTLDDSDTPLRSEDRVGVGQVETDEIEASRHEGLTISTLPGTKIDDRPTALYPEQAYEIVAQFNPATRHRLAQPKSSLLFVVGAQILPSDVHRRNSSQQRPNEAGPLSQNARTEQRSRPRDPLNTERSIRAGRGRTRRSRSGGVRGRWWVCSPCTAATC